MTVLRNSGANDQKKRTGFRNERVLLRNIRPPQ